MDIKEFKKELKALLVKHDVSIGFSVSACSDTHGLYDEKLVVSDENNEKHTLTDSWWLDGSDL